MKSSENALRCVACFAVAFFLLSPLFDFAPSAAVRAVQEHELHLYHTHTGERLDIVYRRGDDYIPAAIAKLDYFLRDHRTGEVRHFDPKLYDILRATDRDRGPSGR